MDSISEYTGNGAYCYANSLHMCLRVAEPETTLHSGILEALTLMPFGCFLVENGDLQVFLASPSWNSPDHGVTMAIRHIGWRCDLTACSDREGAQQQLRNALVDGPVMLGPLDMSALTYYARRGPVGPVTDHYVVALAVRGDRFVIHDPNGFPAVEIAADELMTSWGTELEYGQPYTLRFRFANTEHMERAQIIQRCVDSLREKAGKEWSGPGLLGGVAALARTQALVKDGPSSSLIGVMTRFSLSGGARRCLDGAAFLSEAGLARAAQAMADKARLYGRAQYEAVKEDWPSLAECFEDLAAAEERFLASLKP